MYFARAGFVFEDNFWKPELDRGTKCLYKNVIVAAAIGDDFELKTLYDPTIASLLNACDVDMTFY